MTRHALSILPLLWVSLVCAANDTPMRAGVWREKMHVTIETVDGKPPQPGDRERFETTEDCFTAEEMEDPMQFFGASAADQGCSQLVIAAADGHIDISGSCTFNGLLFSAAGQGRYDDKSYSESISLNARAEGHAVVASGVMTGNYLHECPPDDHSAL